MEILSTSMINELIYNYKSVEVNKRLSSIQTKQNNFSTLSSTLTDVSTKVTNLISSLSTLKTTTSSSIFNAKSASSSKDTLISASAENTANIGSYEIFVTQLAKNDMLMSKDIASSTVSGTSGTHTFTLKTGDGSDPDYTSTVSVELDGTETNLELMEKISDAVNTDYAEVDSLAKTAAGSYTGGASTLKFDVGGTEYSVDVTGGGTYEDLIDELVQQINSDVDGVLAEKILNDPLTGDVRLQLTTENSSDYISISTESGFDLAADLGIEVEKEIGASAVVSASSFTPSSDKVQFSFTAKESGLDYRIKSISDDAGSSILSQLDLNLGASRPTFDQSGDPDTAGFVYADSTTDGNLLNSKFKFNSVQIQNNSNEVDDLVKGVTFNLKSVMAADEPNVSVTVENDNESIREEVNDFITKFNDLYSLLKEKTKSTETDRGILRGEATISSLLNSLRSIGYSTFSDSSSEFQYLSQVGISFNSTSGLSISDSELFNEKINNNSGDVANLFNSSTGLATTFYESLSNYTGSAGYITLAKQSYDNNVEYFSDRIDSISSSIDKSAEVMRKKYQIMQSQLATLLSTQSFFSSS